MRRLTMLAAAVLLTTVGAIAAMVVAGGDPTPPTDVTEPTLAAAAIAPGAVGQTGTGERTLVRIELRDGTVLGRSTVDGFTDYSVVDRFGIADTGAVPEAGARAGAAFPTGELGPLEVGFVGDDEAVHPRLFEALAGGAPLASVRLVVIAPGSDGRFFEVLAIELGGVSVASLGLSGDGSSTPGLDVAFGYETIRHVATPVRDGQPDRPVIAGWDRLRQGPLS